MADTLNLFNGIDFASIHEAATPSEREADEYLITFTKDYPEPDYLLFADGVGTMPTGDIQAVKAKSKNGKTFLCSILAASILGCSKFGLESRRSDNKVLFFDTEQNPRNAQRLLRNVHRLLGWELTDRDEIKAFALREMDKHERLPYIERQMEQRKPTAVFIDGIGDLEEDFNNNVSSGATIETLLKLSAKHDCAIVCVLHTNKAKDDNGMKGHLGTLLLQKSSDVFEVKKDKQVFTVTQTETRNAPIDGFTFYLDEHSTPAPSTAEAMDEKTKREAIRREALTITMRECFNPERLLRHGDLAMVYSTKADKSIATAKRDIGKAVKFGIISKTKDGRYELTV